MESQEQFQQGGPKRPIKPEEQCLIDELARLVEQHGDQFPYICEYVQKEADRITKGQKSAEEERMLDVEGGKPIRLTYKVSVPTEKYPNFNYVGRILGPKGSTLRGMQEISGCKLAVLGRGSMKDKEKEEQCRKEGGKYAHLNEDLHLWMQATGVPDMVFYKLYVACKEIKKYLHADYNDEIFTEQMMVLEQEGGLPKGYTAARGGPRGGRGGNPRGMMQGRGGRGAMMPGMARGSMRGSGMMRGTGGVRVSRGGVMMRGGRGMHRGATTGSTVNSDTIYEDVYEPAPQPTLSNTFENGGMTSNGSNGGSSYFEEFPEPSTESGLMGLGFQRNAQRSAPGKPSRLGHMPGFGGMHQKAF